MPVEHADFIGDIHGHADALEDLLAKLGYDRVAGRWRHLGGRKAVFLGDYIDRGPRIRDTLHIVKGMVEAGEALAILGNHEYNALCYHTRGDDGEYLRKRCGENRKQHQATLDQFAEDGPEWKGWLEWFRSLPLYLDTSGFRAVHACWHPKHIALLGSRTLSDGRFLRETVNRELAAFRAIDCVLKGLEVPLPGDLTRKDKDGKERREIRVKWWRHGNGDTYRDLIFPDSEKAPAEPVPGDVRETLPGYAPTEPPVFFGHYWIPGNEDPVLQAPNVCCLDYSVAKGGRLAAYRWDGERELTLGRMETVRVREEC